MSVRISVIVPLYNKGPYVEQAIASILRSRHAVHEVLVIDDGSSDDGPARVAALGARGVRLIAQPHAGVAAARNRGIEEASGDYVAFLDADDYWDPDYLPAIVELIARLPGCGMYATHFYYFRDDGWRDVPRLRAIKPGAQRIDRFFELWSRGTFFCTCSVVIPLARLRSSGIRFPEGEQHGEDQDVWFRLGERWPVGYLPEPLVGYRMGVPGSLARSFAADELPCVQRLAQRYRANAIPAEHRKGVRRIIGVTRLAIAQHLLATGERRRATRLLYDLAALRAPRYWLRLFLAAHMPAALGRHLLP
ncbi:MAG TPA: glycosyltransferase [Burkholderiales bacterium]|nr:glycosyltransferase [Burkholderiales bacterium]